MVTTVDQSGIDFIRVHEGHATKAYRDSGGVITIGYGFTMDSKVFADWWRAKYGRGLQMGDTMTMEDQIMLVGRVINEEYAPPVVARFGRNLSQHEFNACTSVCYNAGPGALHDKWAAAFAAGDVAGAAALLRKDRVTARGGIFVQGLVNRRAAEATLLLTGDHGSVDDQASVSTHSTDVMAYQKILVQLGYYHGAIDGVAGDETIKAVKAFQAAHPDLKEDGRVGPATRASLERAVAAPATGKTGAATVVITTAAAATVTATQHVTDWMPIVIGVAAFAFIGALIWFMAKHKSEIQTVINKKAAVKGTTNAP